MPLAAVWRSGTRGTLRGGIAVPSARRRNSSCAREDGVSGGCEEASVDNANIGGDLGSLRMRQKQEPEGRR